MNPERKSSRPRQDAEEVGVFTGRKEKPIMKQPTKATKQRRIGTGLARKAVATIIMHTNDNGCVLNFIASTF